MSGKLYIVATPIGNLEDITLRALRVLKEADLAAAENTRHAMKLFSHYSIDTPLTVYSRDKNTRRAEFLLNRVKQGDDVALISNAGTPGLSDPGSSIVRAALEKNLPVVPVPGPSAFAAAISVSGMPSSGILFLGYLSPKSGRRKKQLARHAFEGLTLVIYESPHRVLGTLKDACEVLGPRNAVVARELTKKFEEVLSADLASLVEVFSERAPRGEFTLLISGKHEENEE